MTEATSQHLPVLPLRDIVVFPYMIIPLFVGREASIRSVEDALAKNRRVELKFVDVTDKQKLLSFIDSLKEKYKQ